MASQGRIKRKRKTNFTQISNLIIRNHFISPYLSRVYEVMSSKDDNWIFYNDPLAYESAMSVGKFKTCIKELIDIGLIERIRTRDDRGRLGPNDYIIVEPEDIPNFQEIVESKSANTENLTMVRPTTDGEVTPNNTYINNTNIKDQHYFNTSYSLPDNVAIINNELVAPRNVWLVCTL